MIILSHTAKTCPHLDTITSFIAKKPLPFDGKGFFAVDFIPEVMLISRIIGTNILPTQQLSALSLDRAKFVYAFLHGDSIDLGSVICAHMLKIFRSNKANLYLPYACLIHKLVLLFEISYPYSIPRVKSLAKIGLSTLSQTIAHKKKSKTSSSYSTPSQSTVVLSDHKYLMESMKLVLERTSAMMTDLPLIKADSQLTWTKLQKMQADKQRKVETISQLQADIDLISYAHTIL